MKIKNYLLFIVSILIFSCSDNEDIQVPVPTPTPQKILQSGVVISFDDDFVNEWYDVNAILKDYNWKATFFVTKFDQLTADEIQKLKDLKKEGHEIAAHGLNHWNAPYFINKKGVNGYLNMEINPMIYLMNCNDLHTTSFAYPYGARDAKSDEVLLNKFQIIRGTTYGDPSPDLQNCYYNNSRLVFGLGIDNSYPHFSIPYFISLLDYANTNHKIVIFYAHKTVPVSTSNYETEYETLTEICHYVKTNHMRFYKMSELYNIEKSI